jgi:hypothetical protein
MTLKTIAGLGLFVTGLLVTALAVDNAQARRGSGPTRPPCGGDDFGAREVGNKA